MTRSWTSTMKTITEEKVMRMLNPVHPGRFLRTEIIQAHNLTVPEAAKILRVSRPTLSSLLNAKADLSGEMALRFEKATGERWARYAQYLRRLRDGEVVGL